MKYRGFGKLDWKASALGFGAMRLPIVGKDQGNINEAEAIKMTRYAIDHGVNYVDTAYPYHKGKSEVVVGKSLKDRYREKVKLATKMPTWLVNSQKEMDKYLDEQLSRLQTDHIDFYLLHGLTKERWTKMNELNVFEWCDKAISDGRIRYLGFSFHDEFEVFKDIIDSYDGWTFCQIQYNYMDTEYQAGTKGLRYAASKGLAVVVMEPIAGGLLAATPPEEVQAIWNEAGIERTPAEWALQWVWNHPDVSVVLSGMSTMEQVIQNVESVRRSGPNTLTEVELEIISRVREKYLEYGVIGCTGCRYCMPCPEGVDIAEILEFYNEYLKKRADPSAREEIIRKYDRIVSPEEGAKRCAQCGECEDKCPQRLPVRRLMSSAAWLLEQDR